MPLTFSLPVLSGSRMALWVAEGQSVVVRPVRGHLGGACGGGLSGRPLQAGQGRL